MLFRDHALVRALRRRHVGGVRFAARHAFQHPYVTPLEPSMRLDADDARDAAALLARRTGENLPMI
jgi:hypothetical protein